ncbi:ZIP family metal transporter [Candidatus Woesearchaeota archaeon]|nr:ZIP family metal transporter [Candidatus Woesearchaeota archaeon]
MNIPLVWAVAATALVSLLSLVGIVALLVKEKYLDRILFPLVGFSAGALIGGAFLHLIPESADASGVETTVMYVLLGFVGFYIVERVLHWHHCHKHGRCDVHTFTHMSLIGDAIHNMIDGFIIAGSFLASVELGIVTTIAVIAHEIPQEIGDFGILVFGGFDRWKALGYNFLIALTAVIGAVLGIYLGGVAEGFVRLMVPVAAGGFLYIGASDLIPELHKEPKLGKSVLSFVFFALGLLLMFGTRMLFHA